MRHLGGPAVLVGHSISGGAVTIAAAQAPELVDGIVELAPFTRKQSISLGDLRVKRYRTGMTRLAMAAVLGSVQLVAQVPRRRLPRPQARRLGRPAAAHRRPT